MDLTNYFNDQYIRIDATDNNAIKLFLQENADENIEKRYIEPLQTIFVHKTYNEMFLILNCIELDLERIKDECINWENNVLSYVNFGEEFKENKKYLKYNTILLIICKEEAGEEDNIYRYKIEKSKTICRKIFILVNSKGEILKDNKTMIPFYFKTMDTRDNEKIKEYETKLNSLLPQDEALRMIIEKGESLNDEEEKLLLRWLEKYE